MTDIAAQVAAALAEAGQAVSGAPMPCTIKRASGGPSTPWGEGEATPEYHEVTGLQDTQTIRDNAGAVVSQVRVVTVDALGVAPLASDMIAVGVARADVSSATRWEAITRVTPLAPAGVAVMYEIELAS